MPTRWIPHGPCVKPYLMPAPQQVAAQPRPSPPQEKPAALAHLVRGAGAVLLQREINEHMNEAVAAAAAAAGVPVLLVRGGGGAQRLPGLPAGCP